MKYHGIIISDIHFGAIDNEQLKKELFDSFIYYLKGMKRIDYIVITGDYFDHKLYLNDKTSDYAMEMMNIIVSISKIHSCPIRIIYGTESHEVDQYKIFNIYENDPNIDFKVIYTVTEEELLKDLHVLYVPEEYIYSKSEYYENYFNNKDKYNYIFGHGVIQEIMSYVNDKKETKKSERKKVPIFKSSELLNCCFGQVYFGHYHINSSISNRIFYVGSFSRWCHGEMEPKGFYHITYNSDKKSYSQKFIENSLAKKYITYTYGYDNGIMDNEENLLKELEKQDKISSMENGDNIRYVFNIPENHSNPEFIINLVNERYKTNDKIKVKIVNGYVEKKKKINKEVLNDVINKYPIIFDKNAKLEDKIAYFIKEKYESDLSVDIIKEILYKKGC